ncbi:hypothetical protein HBH98_148160 [Parastagonospora nodorum]|nr:hypothetical protein HBH53_165190 [Parastagonospora nodorum]KAH3967672.1 hypothetical protein HBH51_134980 [Parastagonospora nodorum]KAH3990526.1 hypothetical protein HBH52_000470 [Parastagonospora nodorum]KAH4006538.1 hypothetical protein HBI10_011470 [Parastagonospora nodorum]KAH4011563.1 hypothetical protein HBI13_199110 [Parastagonospora nodorum]
MVILSPQCKLRDAYEVVATQCVLALVGRDASSAPASTEFAKSPYFSVTHSGIADSSTCAVPKVIAPAVLT